MQEAFARVSDYPVFGLIGKYTGNPMRGEKSDTMASFLRSTDAMGIPLPTHYKICPRCGKATTIDAIRFCQGCGREYQTGFDDSEPNSRAKSNAAYDYAAHPPQQTAPRY